MKRNPLEWLSEILLTATAIPILLMMVHITLDVVLKYTMSMPIQGTLEISAYYYMVAIVVLPMASVELARQSIAVDLFYVMLPYRAKVATTGFVLMISAAAYGGLALISGEDAIVAFEKREAVMGTVRIAIWPARLLLPCAFLTSFLVCVYYFIRLCTSSQIRRELTDIHQVDPETEVA